MRINKLGIVMAMINCQTYSRQCYESLVPRDGLEVRWFMIDQGSTDSTPAWIESLVDAGAPVEDCLQTENIGVARAWNLGIKLAFEWGADAVLVANNDVVFAPDYLHNLLPWVEEEGEIFVTGRVVGVHPSEFHALDGVPACARTHDWQPYPQFTQFLLTREVLDKLGEPLFDEGYVLAYFEDNDAVERMAAAGIRSGSVGDAHLIHYCSRSINEGGVKHQWAYNLNEQRFVDKYGYIPAGGVRPAHLPPIPMRPEVNLDPYRVLPE